MAEREKTNKLARPIQREIACIICNYREWLCNKYMNKYFEQGKDPFTELESEIPRYGSVVNAEEMVESGIPLNAILGKYWDVYIRFLSTMIENLEMDAYLLYQAQYSKESSRRRKLARCRHIEGFNYYTNIKINPRVSSARGVDTHRTAESKKKVGGGGRLGTATKKKRVYFFNLKTQTTTWQWESPYTLAEQEEDDELGSSQPPSG